MCVAVRVLNPRHPPIAGMILERINGKSVDKIVMDKEFHDIYYIRDMLLEVFTALDAAQRAFGYVLRV